MLVTSLNNLLISFLGSTVAAKVFHSPDVGEKGFLAFAKLHFNTVQGSAFLDDDLFVYNVFLCQGDTEAVG